MNFINTASKFVAAATTGSLALAVTRLDASMFGDIGTALVVGIVGLAAYGAVGYLTRGVDEQS
jgi:hypothetical protein